MMSQDEFWRGIGFGAVSGVLCGWTGILINMVTGAFPFEMNTAMLLTTFAVGGAVFGIVVGGFMSLTQSVFMFDAPMFRAVILSVGFWMTLRLVAVLMTLAEPIRYHSDMAQSLQGLVLSIILGGILGTLWRRNSAQPVKGRM